MGRAVVLPSIRVMANGYLENKSNLSCSYAIWIVSNGSSISSNRRRYVFSLFDSYGWNVVKFAYLT